MEIEVRLRDNSWMFGVFVDGREVGMGGERECILLADELRDSREKAEAIYKMFENFGLTREVI